MICGRHCWTPQSLPEPRLASRGYRLSILWRRLLLLVTDAFSGRGNWMAASPRCRTFCHTHSRVLCGSLNCPWTKSNQYETTVRGNTQRIGRSLGRSKLRSLFFAICRPKGPKFLTIFFINHGYQYGTFCGWSTERPRRRKNNNRNTYNGLKNTFWQDLYDVLFVLVCKAGLRV